MINIKAIEHKMINGIAHKECTKCERMLPLSAYGTESKAVDKKKSMCKECKAGKQREYVENNYDKEVKRWALYNAEKRVK